MRFSTVRAEGMGTDRLTSGTSAHYAGVHNHPRLAPLAYKMSSLATIYLDGRPHLLQTDRALRDIGWPSSEHFQLDAGLLIVGLDNV